jgi:drug/metabolite transporter (DMT)-like permease
MSKWALSSSGPLFLLVVQLAASVMFLVTAALITRKKIKLDKSSAVASFTGVFEPTLGYGLGNIGLAMTTASVATLISASEAPLVCVLMYIIFGVRPNAFTAVALAGIAAGVFLIVQPSLLDESRGHPLMGNIFVLAGALAAAFYVTLSSRLVNVTEPLPLLISQQIMGLLLALLWLAAAIVVGWEEVPRRASIEQIAFAAASGVVEFGPPFWLFLVAMKGLSANAVSVLIALVPVVAVVEAHLYLGEHMVAVQWIGSALVIAATVIAKRT